MSVCWGSPDAGKNHLLEEATFKTKKTFTYEQRPSIGCLVVQHTPYFEA